MKKDLKNTKFNLVCCGGTFDLLHKGHKEFLSFALSKGKKVAVGLVSDSFAKERLKDTNPFLVRKKALELFFKEIKAFDKVEIAEINDLYGPTLSKTYSFEAIVVTENTLPGAKKINKERKKANLKPLDIVICPMSFSKDGKAISSSRIKNGEIDREGTFILPSFLRDSLKKPMEKLIKDPESFLEKSSPGVNLMTVGDETTRTFVALGIKPKISIIDFYVARKKKYESIKELGFLGNERIIELENKAGTINPSLFIEFRKILGSRNKFGMTLKDLKEPVIILIKGEEDLCVLPLILTSPMGFELFYGQPGQGIVRVLINRKNKEKASKILADFSIAS